MVRIVSFRNIRSVVRIMSVIGVKLIFVIVLLVGLFIVISVRFWLIRNLIVVKVVYRMIDMIGGRVVYMEVVCIFCLCWKF